jgi:hypothetical protein
VPLPQHLNNHNGAPEQQHSSALEQHSITDLKMPSKLQRSHTGPCMGNVSDSEESVQLLGNSGPLPVLGGTAGTAAVAVAGSTGGGNGTGGSSSGGAGSAGNGNSGGSGGGAAGGAGGTWQVAATSGPLPSTSDGKRRSTRAGKEAALIGKTPGSSCVLPRTATRARNLTCRLNPHSTASISWIKPAKKRLGSTCP